MSVLACSRHGCSNIMCNRYSFKYGYICNECFDELVKSDLTVSEFMDIYKGDNMVYRDNERIEYLEEIFKINNGDGNDI